jgi:hypothetical protein
MSYRSPGQPGSRKADDKHADLICDVGFHRGEDTAFYLKKGFRVVAFEAHPRLAENGRPVYRFDPVSRRAIP